MDRKFPSTRRFTGKTSGFKDNRERHFYQRMLKAYLKGKEVFHFGFTDVQDPETGFMHRVPAKHNVEFKANTESFQDEAFYEKGYTAPGKPYGSTSTKKEIRDLIKARLKAKEKSTQRLANAA